MKNYRLDSRSIQEFTSLNDLVCEFKNKAYQEVHKKLKQEPDNESIYGDLHKPDDIAHIYGEVINKLIVKRSEHETNIKNSDSSIDVVVSGGELDELTEKVKRMVVLFSGLNKKYSVIQPEAATNLELRLRIGLLSLVRAKREKRDEQPSNINSGYRPKASTNNEPATTVQESKKEKEKATTVLSQELQVNPRDSSLVSSIKQMIIERRCKQQLAAITGSNKQLITEASATPSNRLDFAKSSNQINSNQSEIQSRPKNIIEEPKKPSRRLLKAGSSGLLVSMGLTFAAFVMPFLLIPAAFCLFLSLPAMLMGFMLSFRKATVKNASFDRT